MLHKDIIAELWVSWRIVQGILGRLHKIAKWEVKSGSKNRRCMTFFLIDLLPLQKIYYLIPLIYGHQIVSHEWMTLQDRYCGFFGSLICSMIYPLNQIGNHRCFLHRFIESPIRFHDLKHTNVSLRIEQGRNLASMSRQIGHSNVSTTLNVYSHLLKEGGSVLHNNRDFKSARATAGYFWGIA